LSCGIYTQISVTEDSNARFSDYKTFAWLQDQLDTSNSPYNNDIIRNNIRNYIGQSFAERGFTVNLDTPDVLLQVVISNQKMERKYYYPSYPKSYYYCPYYYCSEYYFPYTFEYYYRYPGKYCYSMGYCEETIKYVEGSITLNVIDRKQSKLIWAGTAKGDIYDSAYIKRSIHPAVEAIMRKFPVKQIEYKKKVQPADDVLETNNSIMK
jgi:hypothetical protein